MSERREPPRTVVAVDIETVSLHPSGVVWEFGAVRRSAEPTAGTWRRTWSVMLKDPDLRHADPEALAVGRFYDRHNSSKGPLLSGVDFARRIEEATANAVVLVNNAAFDIPRMERVLRSHARLPRWWYRPIDVVDMGRGWIASNMALAAAVSHEIETEMWSDLVGRDPHQMSSAEVSRALGVPLPNDDERHTALGDARWVLRMYDAICGRANPAGAVGRGGEVDG